MKIYQLHRTQTLPITIEAAWTFFSNPHNLATITPPWLDFAMLQVGDQTVYAGQILRYRVRPLWGLPLTWVSEIKHLRPPRFFVDEQRDGPYRLWHHQHHFTPVEGGVDSGHRASRSDR